MSTGFFWAGLENTLFLPNMAGTFVWICHLIFFKSIFSNQQFEKAVVWNILKGMAFLSDQISSKIIANSYISLSHSEVGAFINPQHSWKRKVTYWCFSMWSMRNVHTAWCLRLSRMNSYICVPASSLQKRKAFTSATWEVHPTVFTKADPIAVVLLDFERLSLRNDNCSFHL